MSKAAPGLHNWKRHLTLYVGTGDLCGLDLQPLVNATVHRQSDKSISAVQEREETVVKDVAEWLAAKLLSGSAFQCCRTVQPAVARI